MASLRPIRDKVIVERSEAEEKTAGGIVLPDTAKDKPKEGKIIAVTLAVFSPSVLSGVFHRSLQNARARA